MMSKKKWIGLLLVFFAYLFLGASFFYTVENREEEIRRNQSRQERNEIRDLLSLYYNSSENHTLYDMLYRLSEYSGKTMISESDDEYDTPQKWDFYHSFFFSVTVVTTIGYGNIAPTVSLSRIVMIFYAIVGLPMNGILYATLGQYFGKTFIKLYHRWKNNKVKDYAARLGLVSQITLYLIPGFTIFIFLPAIIMMYMEGWVYDLAVYYCFVTLTTIGFGDYVAGFNNMDFGAYFIVYQIFLIVWIIFGLGYLVMVLGFLTGALRSKKVKQLQKNITDNFKSTHNRLWNGLVKDLTYFRRVINELYMAKFKPVYHDEYGAGVSPKMGSQSFPDLRSLGVSDGSPAFRRRANSECFSSRPLTRAQSDSDLQYIDREATFAGLCVQPSQLLARVVDVLEAEEPEDSDDEGVHGFSDAEILYSERYGSDVLPPRYRRPRAASEIRVPSRTRTDPSVEWTWSGPAASQQIKELRERFKRGREAAAAADTNKTILDRIKGSFIRPPQPAQPPQPPEDEETYMRRTTKGRDSVFSVPEARILEEMTVGELLRVLQSVQQQPRRKPSFLDVFDGRGSRRESLAPAPRKRFSLRPVQEVPLAPTSRRASVHPEMEVTQAPVNRQLARLRGGARTRHESLRDIRIDHL